MMTNLLKTIFNYLLSFAILLAALAIGMGLQILLETSVPGSVLGMLVLFFALRFGLIKLEWVKPSANLIIRYMVLLFVPISVGLMEHFDMLMSNALPILATAVGGSLLVLVSLAWMLERLLKGDR